MYYFSPIYYRLSRVSVCGSHLTLAERQDGGGVVQLLGTDHSLHVKDLGVHALHQHREEVWVAEVQRALGKRN